jgi:hypothetical protein
MLQQSMIFQFCFGMTHYALSCVISAALSEQAEFAAGFRSYEAEIAWKGLGGQSSGGSRDAATSIRRDLLGRPAYCSEMVPRATWKLH